MKASSENLWAKASINMKKRVDIFSHFEAIFHNGITAGDTVLIFNGFDAV